MATKKLTFISMIFREVQLTSSDTWKSYWEFLRGRLQGKGGGVGVEAERFVVNPVMNLSSIHSHNKRKREALR